MTCLFDTLLFAGMCIHTVSTLYPHCIYFIIGGVPETPIIKLVNSILTWDELRDNGAKIDAYNLRVASRYSFQNLCYQFVDRLVLFH